MSERPRCFFKLVCTPKLSAGDYPIETRALDHAPQSDAEIQAVRAELRERYGREYRIDQIAGRGYAGPFFGVQCGESVTVQAASEPMTVTYPNGIAVVCAGDRANRLLIDDPPPPPARRGFMRRVRAWWRRKK